MTSHIIEIANVSQLHQVYSFSDSFSETDNTFIEEDRASGATVKFSPDGNVVASLGFDTSLHVFDTKTREKIYSQYATRPTFVGSNRPISFHPHETCVLVNHDSNVSLINYSSGQVQTFEHATTGNDDWSQAFSSDGQFWACQKLNRNISVYEFSTGEEKYSYSGHTSLICGMLFSPNNELLATAGHYISSGRIDETVRLWDIRSGQLLHVLRPKREHMPMAIAFSPDSEILAVSYFVETVGEIYLYDVPSGNVIQVLQGHSRPISYLAFSGDGKRLATTSWDNSIRLWNTATGHEINRWNPKEDLNVLFVGLKFNRNESLLISGMREEGMIFLDAESGEIVSRIHVPDLLHFDISPDQATLAIGTWDGIKLWHI